MIAPGREQIGLGGVEPCAAYHESVPLPIGTLRDPHFAADHLVDRHPGRLVDGVDGCDYALVLIDGDRVADIVVPTCGDHVFGVEARVGPQRHRTARPAPADAADQLADEPRPPRGAPHGVGPGGNQRALAEHLRVAVGGAVFLIAEDLTDGGVDVDGQRPCARAGTEPQARASTASLRASSGRARR